ncbi:SDR family oxidoreductase [Acetobacter nitrogenifigens]|uniref:Short chain dehydrogenase n=1 Tax=Acetobacter nitrogenifigens DSM 23921 = NBRC 105050 TaxID=1120919 RepID=A0A511XA94_9PROT|nr:SDR family oxidoreductase [Acetobacter nitrogenifigens]GEN59874.1 short chain dehydrogenase [Acetobacter nitrogenifigens DSM 23921 = NBRC 105050]
MSSTMSGGPTGALISETIPRAALVTGGARRLGRTIVLALAEAGFSVAIHHRGDQKDAAKTLRDIEALGVRGCLLQADLAREDEVTSLMSRAAAELGPLGVLVNNASTFDRDEWDTATRESWDAHIEPNLRAPFVLTQAFAAAMPDDMSGMVLNMLDERVWSLTPHFVTYTVSKSALWTLTQTMALALAPKGIRVNAIGPGPALPSPRQTEAEFRRQCASTPLRRGTSPEEVARAALSLLALPSVTGQMLALDGGQHMQWHPAPTNPADAVTE